jgi:chemotaxis protein CheD
MRDIPMTSSTAQHTADHVAVGIGQAAFAAAPTELTTILGSCIAVTLYSPRHRSGMLSHVVLPHSSGSTTYPAKFADTAVDYMLTELHNRGIRRDGLIAKMAGGACMFGDGKFMQIGETNTQATIIALNEAGIRIVGQDVGGTVGRRICFVLATGDVTVESLGQPKQTI